MPHLDPGSDQWHADKVTNHNAAMIMLSMAAKWNWIKELFSVCRNDQSAGIHYSSSHHIARSDWC